MQSRLKFQQTLIVSNILRYKTPVILIFTFIFLFYGVFFILSKVDKIYGDHHR